MESYSVLMSVYYKEKPEYLRESIESMLNQTVQPEDFVIVCDGPLTPELEEVLKSYTIEYPRLLNIVRLKSNIGIGGAANAGLVHCKNDLVAKMDSDDIALPQRCELQLKFMQDNPDIAVVGAYLGEFLVTVDIEVAVRRVPIHHEEIYEYAKRRMPFNNQTVMYRKSVVEAVGGYRPMRRCEDYDLFFRILHAGYRCANIDEVLVLFRLNEDAYARRGSVSNLKGFVAVRWKMYRAGFSGFTDFIVPCMAQVVLSVSPAPLKRWIYEKHLRK